MQPVQATPGASPRRTFSFLGVLLLIVLLGRCADAQDSAAQVSDSPSAASSSATQSPSGEVRHIPALFPPTYRDRMFARRKALESRLRPEASTPASVPPLAPFLGNLTSIAGSSDQILLLRQPDCSLTLFNDALQASAKALTGTAVGSVPKYERILHDNAFLATKPDRFAAGCKDPTIGVPSRVIMVGQEVTQAASAASITSGLSTRTHGDGDSEIAKIYNTYAVYVAMTCLFYGPSSPECFDAEDELEDVIDFIIDTESGSLMTGGSSSAKFIGRSEPYLTPESSSTAVTVSGVAVGDFNRDGINDVVSVNNGSITVFLAKSGGALKAGAIYNLPVVQVTNETAVVDDVNGDGKLDIVVATTGETKADPGQIGYQIWVFLGKGDGTFKAPLLITATEPTLNLITGSFTGKAAKDIVTGSGQLFLGSSTGNFTLASTPAFPPPANVSSLDTLATGDFNKDGKLDLAANFDGLVSIYLGKGNGTFTPGRTYVANGNTDLLATDLDGDGNLDLYFGTGNGGFFSGNISSSNPNYASAYALMGHGNGTFSGAIATPFTFRFGGAAPQGLFSVNLDGAGNIADLNKDGKLDAIAFVPGTGEDVFLTAALGKKDGSFAAGPSLQISPFTYNNQTAYLYGGIGAIDSYAIADFNGDGIPDVLYAQSAFYQGDQGTTPAGFFIALGKGDGSFETPVFTKAPSFYTDKLDSGQKVTLFTTADFNHDGKADIMYYLNDSDFTGAQKPIREAVIQLGNGDGTFQIPILVPLSGGTYPGQNLDETMPTMVADVNGDRIPDLVVAQYSGKLYYPYGPNQPQAGTQVAIYIGKGDGTFKAPHIADAADNALPAVLADMNGDGKLDLVTTGAKYGDSYFTSDDELAVSLGNGDGTFKRPAIYSQKFDFYKSYQNIRLAAANAVAADFNGDGKMDIILGQDVYLGRGDGTLEITDNLEGTQILDIGGNGYVFAADFNGDGKPDLLWNDVLLLNEYGTKIAGGALTSTSLTASVAEQGQGQPITFTAEVSTESGAPVGSGSVAFQIDGATARTVKPNSAGQAVFTTSLPKLGTYQVEAQYLGDSAYAASGSATLTETILKPSPAPPVISPDGGKFTTYQKVTITDAAKNASIYYTVDGSTPTFSSNLYKSTLTLSEYSILKASAATSGSALSPPATAIFDILRPPTCITQPVSSSSITAASATLTTVYFGWNLPGSVWFAYGASKTALKYSTPKQSQPASPATQFISARIKGLKSKTTYYFQGIAETKGGTTKGAILSFTTP